MRRAATAKSKVCTPAARLRLRVAAEKEPLDLRNQVRKPDRQGTAAGIDYDLTLRTQQKQAGTDSFPDSPLDAIPNHRVAQGAGHGNPDPGTAAIRQPDEKGRKRRTREPGATVVGLAEVAGTENPDTFWKTRDIITFRN